MPVTTFLSANELNIPTTDKELNDVLAEVRLATGQDWQVTEIEYFTSPKWWMFWQKPKPFSRFSVYVYVGGVGPWQQINFYRSPSSSTFNPSSSATTTVNYLYGILAGVHAEKLKNDQTV